MTWVVLLVATALFCAALDRSKLIGLSLSIVRETNGALGTLTDASLDDDARERAAQAFAIRMFGMFARVFGLTVLVLTAPAAIMVACVAAGATSSQDIWQAAMSWPFIAANIALFLIVLARGVRA